MGFIGLGLSLHRAFKGDTECGDLAAVARTRGFEELVAEAGVAILRSPENLCRQTVEHPSCG